MKKYLRIILISITVNLSLNTYSQVKKKPNIILIITDDQGYGDLGCHGNPYIKTPFIDKLHKESVRLTDFHSGTTCSPTRAGLLTGRNCNRVGVWHTLMSRHYLRKDETTIAEIFSENNYSTAIFGKWHLGDHYQYRPRDRGFQEVLIHGGGGISQQSDYWNNDYFDDKYWHNGTLKQYEGYCTDVWFDNAMTYIEKKTKEEKPFFCYIPTNAAHAPRIVDKKYSTPYKNNKGIPNASFYGMLTNIDENVGRLEKKLEELNIKDNTILIYMSDNGSAGVSEKRGFNAGMRGRKGSHYDGGHRVPFFIRWKDGKLSKGKDINDITQYTDIFPTLLELAGIPKPNIELDGLSLVPLLRGKKWKERTLFIDTQRNFDLTKGLKSAVMTNNWRLINGKELYEIKKDVGQRNNIASEHPNIVKKMNAAYNKWWESVSKRSEEINTILIGDNHENPITLLSHDLNSEKKVAHNQDEIRQGYAANGGSWNVSVAKKGNYKFTIRRWPKESGLKLGEGTPKKKRKDYKPTKEGIALIIKSAKIKVGNKTKETVDIDLQKEGILFEMELQKGETTIEASFTDDKGVVRDAYYLEIELIS